MVSDKSINTNGTQTVFSSDFPIISEDHLRVFLDDVVVSRDDYDLINNAAVFFEAPAAGQNLVVQVGTTPGEVLSSPTDIGVVSTHIVEVQTVANNIGDVNALGDLIHSTNEYTVASVEPTAPTPGDRWFDTTTDTMKHYNSTAWIDTGLDSVKLTTLTPTQRSYPAGENSNDEKYVYVDNGFTPVGNRINFTPAGTGGVAELELSHGGITEDSGQLYISGTKKVMLSTDMLDDDTMGNASNTTLATSESIKAYVDTHILSSAMLDDDTMANTSATTLATSESIKAYVDAHIPQVIQTVVQPHTTSQVITNAGTDIAGFSATITPKSTTSRIRVDIRWFGEVDDSWNIMFNITRNGTSINLPSASGGIRNQGLCAPTISYGVNENNDTTPETAVFSTIDSPASAGTITYKLRANSDSNRTMFTGRTWSDSNTTGHERATGEIILTEIL